jgi:glycosyltransferase involved in cell wall biosynthesis
MKRIRILVSEVKNAGIGKFRFTDPHIMLQKNHNEDFLIDIIENPPLNNKEFMADYDMFFGQGSMLLNDQIFAVLEKYKREGLKIVLDIDDYWRLPVGHAMYKKMETQFQTLISRLQIADLVTTTTTNLAKEIFKYNKNVKVLENAINPLEEQYISSPIQSEKTRVGWVGGSSHLEDLRGLKSLVNHLATKHSNEVQMVMAGFNNQVKNIETGEVTTSRRPEVWMQCEMIFTNRYQIKNQEYLHFLLDAREGEFPGVENEFYKRIWTRPIQSYATAYNEIDIVLAPLKDNTFNKMKSQLKVIEAGFHKKPLIASELYPYQIDGIHKKNCLLVPEKKEHKEWYENAKMLIKNNQMRVDLGEALYETVKDKYDLKNVTRKRAQLYKSLF